MITTVTSAAALNAALKTAQSGDTIQLASGTYAGVVASNLHFAGGVTVTAAPGADAVVTSFNVTGSSGLTFSGLELYADPANGANVFTVSSSQDIHLDHLNVHGTLDNDPSNDVSAMLIRTSSNVSVTNSEFQQLMHGLAQLNNDHLTISGNEFHDMRVDGVRGGGSSFVTVTNNSFHDFHPLTGDHGDAIQFWTTNTTASAHDITVTDNIFYRGAGDVAQGVFFRDQVGGLPYINVTIAGNFIIGGMYNGIAVGGGQTVSIHDNTVIGFTDMKSWIRLDNVDGATLANNTANTLLTNTTDTNLTVTGEVTAPLASDGGAAALALWNSLHALAPAPVGLTLAADAGYETMTGGALGDTLSGVASTDTLAGGAGDDLYLIDTTKPGIVELAGGGHDTVQSNISYTLPGFVEDLVLAGTRQSSGNGNSLDNQLTGNDQANTLAGQAGNDTLVGAGGDDTLTGGSGADLLTGGAGADHFVFAKGDGHDTIVDFGAGGHDVIDISALLNAGYQPTLTDSTAGVTIGFTTGDSILLQGVHASALHSTALGFVF